MHIAFGFKAIKTKQFVFIYAFHYVSMTLLLHFSKKWKEEKEFVNNILSFPQKPWERVE
jgi:hypothetical protein